MIFDILYFNGMLIKDNNFLPEKYNILSKFCHLISLISEDRKWKVETTLSKNFYSKSNTNTSCTERNKNIILNIWDSIVKRNMACLWGFNDERKTMSNFYLECKFVNSFSFDGQMGGKLLSRFETTVFVPLFPKLYREQHWAVQAKQLKQVNFSTPVSKLFIPLASYILWI